MRCLRGTSAAVEEHVHQHGLAAADLANQIQAGGHIFLGMSTAQQARQQTGGGGSGGATPEAVSGS